MSSNTVQILFDSGDKTIVKLTGYYDGAANETNIVVAANTLNYANNSAPACVLSAIQVQSHTNFANGYALLYWAGSSGNADLLALGGTGSGEFITYMPNPLASNSANLNGGGGDVGLKIVHADPYDSYSIILTLIKEGGGGGGYANVYISYNDNDFNKIPQPY